LIINIIEAYLKNIKEKEQTDDIALVVKSVEAELEILKKIEENLGENITVDFIKQANPVVLISNPVEIENLKKGLLVAQAVRDIYDSGGEHH
jgi:hypothetical protein